jgi:CheY-like chemotaxis protein
MVVDDSALIRMTAADTIKSIMPDCAVIESEDGKDAVRKCAQLQPEIVFMDIDMPIVNGFIALNIIKDKQRDARIIMMTADQREETREKAAHLGAHGFLTKPFGREDLINVLKEL